MHLSQYAFHGSHLFAGGQMFSIFRDRFFGKVNTNVRRERTRTPRQEMYEEIILKQEDFACMKIAAYSQLFALQLHPSVGVLMSGQGVLTAAYELENQVQTMHNQVLVSFLSSATQHGVCTYAATELLAKATEKK